jgi:peptidyl-prolyl cis-trans isomerase-like protein 2
VTGAPLKLSDLIKLKFHRNSHGKLYCPSTFKVFTDHTHIVAIRTTGNVYSAEAIQNFCVKLNNWKDLLDETPFTKSDIITIQDPNDMSRNVNNYHHLNHGLKGDNDSSKNETINETQTIRKILTKAKNVEGKDKLTKKKTVTTDQNDNLLYHSKQNTSKSCSLTSTAMNIVVNTDQKEEEKKKFKSQKMEQYERIKKQKKKEKKAFVTLHTSMGDLNLELYPYLVPQTCDNFLGLCENGYYNNLKFHRLMKGFMIQGGDPTGTGKGGESLWNEDFKDEFHPKLKHDQPGILSMANKGKDTNNSQFFITFKACPHLDNKHSVFGKVVGGLHILSEMEQVTTDTKQRPLTAITIERATVFNNPFKEDELEQEQKKKQEELNQNAEMGQWFSNPTPEVKPVRSGVGKYINADAMNNGLNLNFGNPLKRKATVTEAADVQRAASQQQQPTKKQKTSGQFNFSKW